MLHRPQRPPPRPPTRAPTEAQRKAAKAARQRRYRQNVRDGLAIAPTPYNREILNALIRWHRLDPAEAHSREAIGVAMFEALADAAKR